MSATYRMLTAICCVGLLVCSGCDYPFRLPWEVSDFAWGDEPSIYNACTTSFQCSDGGEKYVAIHWEGRGQLGFMDEFVLLCLQEAQGDYGLEAGVALRTSGFKPPGPPKIAVLRRLRPDCFAADLGCPPGTRLPLMYAGPVEGRSVFDEGQGMDWLGFAVTPKEDCTKVMDLYAKLEPLLQAEPDAQKVLLCMKRLAGSN